MAMEGRRAPPASSDRAGGEAPAHPRGAGSSRTRAGSRGFGANRARIAPTPRGVEARAAFEKRPTVEETRRDGTGTNLHTDVLLRLLLSVDDGLPHRAGAVEDDVRRLRVLQRGEDQAETQPAGAEVHVKLVCWRGRRASVARSL